MSAAARLSVREVNRIYAKRHCRDDAQLAFDILGMAAAVDNPAPVLGTKNHFIDHVNGILDLIAPPDHTGLVRWERQNLQFKASYAVRKVLDAVFAIADFDRQFWWDRNSWQKYALHTLYQLTTDDRPIDATPCAQLAGPLPLAAFTAYVAALPLPRNHAAPPNRITGPTHEDLRERIATRNGMNALGGNGNVQQLTVNPSGQVVGSRAMVGDGMCYWYALSYLYYGTRNNFAVMKADIRKYFMSVLNDPGNFRYRTYAQIELDSTWVAARAGTTSLARSLHNNEIHNGASWRPRFHLGCNQVIADYYHAEVIEIDDPVNWQPRAGGGNTLPANPNWRVRARGDPAAAKQIIIFNHEQHFESGHPPAPWPGVRFPTPAANRRRVKWMPWYPPNAPGVVIPNASMPVAVPAFSGVTNPATRSSQIERNYVKAYRNYPGFMPLLPTAAVAATWATQVSPGMLGGYPVAPPQTAFVAADGPTVPGAMRGWQMLKHDRDTFGRDRPPHPGKRKKTPHEYKAYKP